MYDHLACQLTLTSSAAPVSGCREAVTVVAVAVETEGSGGIRYSTERLKVALSDCAEGELDEE